MIPATCKKLSLVTYNIHKGFNFGKSRFLLPEMRQALIELQVDFAFLQEVQGEHKKREKKITHWPDTPQFAYIAGKFWPYYLYAKNATYHAGHHGNAILSKFAFERFENINLSSINRASRSILHGQIKIGVSPSVNIHLLCIHLGLFKSQYSLQYRTLMDRIRNEIPSNEPILMAGDFNDWRHRLSKPLEEEFGIQEAFFSLEGQHAKSYPSIKPAFCIDRIYFRGIKLLNVQCLQDSPWQNLSDHLPLIAHFHLL